MITEPMTAKASAIEIDELNAVIAEPTAIPVAAEIAIWRTFGETEANRLDEAEADRFDETEANRLDEAEVIREAEANRLDEAEVIREAEFIGAPISSLIHRIPFSF